MSRNGSPINLANARAAKEAGLIYVGGDGPGITRKKQGKTFSYLDPRGRAIKDRQALDRIRMLAIPPAYRDVWICPDPRGHIQAVGWDDRGRKQYRYHPKWREVRDGDKYNRLIKFAKCLPKIRRTVTKHVRLHGLPREKVLAAVVRFMETTLIRVGNDEYAKSNKHYGLTTLQDKHAKFGRGKVKLEFVGKSGVEHEHEIEDPRLAEIAKKCQELPGQELFQYLDDAGKVHDIGSTDVNDYLRETTGEDFTAKYFRTWHGTVLAAQALAELEQFESEAQAKRNIVKAIEQVAQRLGNTKAVCRKCYIHPEVFNAYMEGALTRFLRKRAAALAGELKTLQPEEVAVLSLLKNRMAAFKKAQAAQPKSLKDALQRSLTLVARGGSQSGQARRRKAS